MSENTICITNKWPIRQRTRALPVWRRASALPVRRRARALSVQPKLWINGEAQPPHWYRGLGTSGEALGLTRLLITMLMLILTIFTSWKILKFFKKLIYIFFWIFWIFSNSSHNSWGPNYWLLLKKFEFVFFFLTPIFWSVPNYHWLIKEGIEKKSTLRINSSRLPPFILRFI